MNLIVSKSKNSATYYVQKSFRSDAGKTTARIVERLGSMEELIARFGADDPVGAAKKYVAELTAEEKESRRRVTIEYNPALLIKKDDQRCFNGGYLFLQKVYHELGLEKICKKIEKNYKNEYDLNAILQMLLYTRILYPGSKLSSLEDAKRFIEQPEADIHQVYRALSLLSKESDNIQAAVYKNSLKLGKRHDKVVYYDCTNYYFESEKEGGLRQYGHSKENRPNPIVQMGLFTDMDGIPLAFCINPGNTAETTTLKPLEDKLREKFGLSKIVVCTDGGLSSYENRKNDHVGERAFVTVQSLKKLERHLQDWATETKGWRIVQFDSTDNPKLSSEEYDLAELDPKVYADCLFCRERWIKVGKKGKELEQRLIVTFSFKYREYLQYTREKQVARAQSIIDRGAAGKYGKSSNDPKRFIKSESCTVDGELAQYNSYSLNQEMIDQESRFDGFYGICTDLEDDAPAIIKVNGGRWIVEECFRITKTDFEARPVFLRRDDRITAHFLTCFLALILYKYLAKKINREGKHFTADEIIETLQDMNFLKINGEGYIPTYTRTDLTNNLHASAGFRTDTHIVTRQTMKKIIKSTKEGKQE
ncbi:MAG: IS1634 family transposase [Bacteroidaceae bacterium]|jgi:transposase|nr:IS1634 family transposase [Bacteroidota bacterium]